MLPVLTVQKLRCKHLSHIIAGHPEVDPERKTDPGPRVDWRHLLLALIRPDYS